MKKIIKFIPLALCLLTVQAQANTRYTLMDKDQNNSVDIKEFLEANSNMTEGAFDLIDRDKNKEISLEEWTVFVDRHSSPEGFVEEKSSTTMPARDAMPPQQPNMPTMPPMGSAMPPSEAAKPIVPENERPKLENQNGLPLLTAPKVQSPTVESPNSENLNNSMQIESPKAPTVQSPTINSPIIEQKADDLPLLTPPKQ